MAPSSCRHYNISDEDVQAIKNGVGNINEIQVQERKLFKFLRKSFSGQLWVCHLQQVELWRLRVQRHSRYRERLGLRNRSLCPRSLHPWSCGAGPGNLCVQVFFSFFWLVYMFLIWILSQRHCRLLWPQDKLLHRDCHRHTLHIPTDPSQLQLWVVCFVQGEFGKNTGCLKWTKT